MKQDRTVCMISLNYSGLHMKGIIISLFLCFSWSLPKAQPYFGWAKGMGGGGHSNISKSRVDAAGNIYITGEFADTGIFGSARLIASGFSDSYISKLDDAGNFIWTKQIGGNAIIRSQDIALDDAGNIYITGFFTGTVDFDPGSAVYNLTTNSTAFPAGNDIFVCKLDNNGNFLWATQMAGSTVDYSYSITADATGDVYITGSFTGIVDFDPGAGTFYLDAGSTAPGKIFICKLSSSGSLVWACALTGSDNHGVGNAIFSDRSGHVYITGSFAGTTDFDPGPGVYNLPGSAGSPDIFVLKLTAAGGLVWARHMHGTGNGSAFGIFADAAGYVYYTGGFSGTIDFDPGAGTYPLSGPSLSNIYVSKLDNAGDFLWAKVVAVTSTLYSSTGKDLVADHSGNVYVTGNFAGTADFDPGPGIFNISTNGANNIFVLKLDAVGNFRWALGMGGTEIYYHDQGHSINLDAAGDIILSGRFYDTTNFNPCRSVIVNLIAPPGNYNHYLLKLKQAARDTTHHYTACNSFAYAGQVYYQSGVYTHSFLDAFGCDSTAVMNLTILPYTYSASTDTVHANCLVSYLLQPSDTAVNGYLWDDNSTDSIRSVYNTGVYQVIYEKEGCVIQADSFIVYFYMPELHVGNSCGGLPNGKAWITRHAADPGPYSYTWYNDVSQLMSSSDSISNCPPGNYRVRITHFSGCDTTINFTIADEHYQVFFTADSILCTGTPVRFFNTSDSYFHSFEWQFGDGHVSSVPTPEHRYDSAGVYKVIVAGKGRVCSDTALKTLVVDAPWETLRFIADKNEICTGETIRFIPDAGDNTLVSFYWQMGDGSTFTSTDQVVSHSYDTEGNKTVTLTAHFRACPDTSFTDSIMVHPFPLVALGPDSVVCPQGPPVTLQNQYPHEQGYRYQWSTVATTQQTKVTAPGDYSLTVINQHGCATTERITIDKGCYVDIPNAFTPDGDGVNDFFPGQLRSANITAFRLQVFNRWGQKIFETTSMTDRGWDGRFNDQPVQKGVYIYLIDVRLDNNKEEQYKGNVTLLR